MDSFSSFSSAGSSGLWTTITTTTTYSASWTPVFNLTVVWPYGTVVRRKPGFGEPYMRLMVLTDDGRYFSALVVRGAAGLWPEGTIEANWDHQVWEPDE